MPSPFALCLTPVQRSKRVDEKSLSLVLRLGCMKGCLSVVKGGLPLLCLARQGLRVQGQWTNSFSPLCEYHDPQLSRPAAVHTGSHTRPDTEISGTQVEGDGAGSQPRGPGVPARLQLLPCGRHQGPGPIPGPCQPAPTREPCLRSASQALSGCGEPVTALPMWGRRTRGSEPQLVEPGCSLVLPHHVSTA